MHMRGIRQGLNTLRKEADSRMNTLFVIERRRGDYTDDDGEVHPRKETVWEGHGWIRKVDMLGGAQLAEVANHVSVWASARIHIPHTAPPSRPGDLITVKTAADETLAGRVFRVMSEAVNSYSVTRRIDVSENQTPTPDPASEDGYGSNY